MLLHWRRITLHAVFLHHILAHVIADQDYAHQAEEEPAMMHAHRGFGCILLIAILVIGPMGAAYAQSTPAQEVLTWNEIAMKAAVAGGHDPRQAARLSRGAPY